MELADGRRPSSCGSVIARKGAIIMAAITALLQELEHEAQTTKRVLERVPNDQLAWKPHPKSMSLGQLALHVATVPGNVAEIAAVDTVPTPPAFIQPEAVSSA